MHHDVQYNTNKQTNVTHLKQELDVPEFVEVKVAFLFNRGHGGQQLVSLLPSMKSGITSTTKKLNPNHSVEGHIQP